MRYKLIISETAKKDIQKLDKSSQKLLFKWIEKHFINCEDPRSFGKPLQGNLSGLWRYRIGKYRLICQIIDDKLIVLATGYGIRSKVYDEN